MQRYDKLSVIQNKFACFFIISEQFVFRFC
jgi:hypothetical protein